MNKFLGFMMVLAFFHETSLAQKNIDTLKISNLESLWKIAIENNSTRKVYTLKKEQAAYDFHASTSFIFPQATVGFAGQDNVNLQTTPVPGELLGHPGKTIYLQFGKKYTYNTGLTLTKNLFDWQLLLESKIANENIALATVQQDAFIQTLKTQVGQYYYALLIAKTALEISKKDLLLADSTVQIANDRFKQGLIDAASLNQASINYNTVRQTIFQSEELYQQAVANLKLLAGLTNETVLDDEATPAVDLLSEIKSVELGTDKNLLVYPHNIAIAELQRKTHIAAFLPKFSLTGYIGYQQFRDDFKMTFGNGAWQDYTYIGLNISWPLFTGFSNYNKLKSAAVQKAISEEQYQASIEQGRINDALLRDTYANNKSIALASQNTYHLYAQNLDLSLQKYKEGVISIDTYFKSFEDYLSAENTYLNNLSNLLSVYASILARN
jgi:outer membrane protein